MIRLGSNGVGSGAVLTGSSGFTRVLGYWLGCTIVGIYFPNSGSGVGACGFGYVDELLETPGFPTGNVTG